jgi:predicted O-methyltransferase YrrM
MNDLLESVKAELESFGESNDSSVAERSRQMLNITRDTGEFLSVLVRAARARRILEIGTSNGYSTLWLGEAAIAIGGTVTTLELSEYKIDMARANLERAGVSSVVTIVHGDAASYLQQYDCAAYDLVFLDADRSEYCALWPNLRRALRPSGLLIVDNATSHVAQMAPFVALVKTDPEFATCLVPVGKGEFLAVRSAPCSANPVNGDDIKVKT